jgi:hypothetical protein
MTDSRALGFALDRDRDQARRRLALRRRAALVVALALLSVLALEAGGYGLVTRQQFALGVWAAVAAGLLLGLFPRGVPDRSVAIPAAAAAGLVAWLALSLLWTESDERTVAELARLLGYLGLITLALLALNRHTAGAAATGISLAALGIAALAVGSRLFPQLLPESAVTEELRGDRLSYPLDYWNAVGAWGAMATAIGLGWSAHASRVAVRAALLAAVPVAGLSVYLTYSRAGVITSAVAVLALLALSRNRWTALVHVGAAAVGTAIAILAVRSQPQIADATGSDGGLLVLASLFLAAAICAAAVLGSAAARSDRWRLSPPARRRALAAAALAGLVGIVFAWGPISRGWDEFRSEERVTAGADPAARLVSAGGNRNDLWSSALAAFSDDPLRGTGPGTFEFWWSRDARDPEYVRDAHSLYLEQLAELGLPGLLLTAALLCSLFGIAVRIRARLERPADFAVAVGLCAAFVVFVVSAAVDWQWEITAVGALALGGLATVIAAGSERASPALRRGRIGRPGLRAALIALALAACALQVPGLVSTQLVNQSEEAADEGRLEEARSLAAEAVDAQPWSASPREQLAQVDEARGELDSAEAAIRGAIEREPTNWRYPLVLARIQASRGDRRAALETFRRGRRLRPLSPLYSPFSQFGILVYSPQQLRRLASMPPVPEP